MSAYHYTGCGLPNVYLVNGRPSLDIEDIDGLHSAIGKLLVQKARALDGTEIRFLRREMNRSQTELGAQLGVSCKTVTRWEKDTSRIKREADLTLRLMYLEFLDCPCSREALAHLMNDPGSNSEPETIRLERDHWQWRPSGQ